MWSAKPGDQKKYHKSSKIRYVVSYFMILAALGGKVLGCRVPTPVLLLGLC